MSTPINSTLVVLRAQRDEDGFSKLSIRKRSEADLTGYTFLRTVSNTDEYVHNDDYDHYAELLLSE